MKKAPVIPTAFETPTYDETVAETATALDTEMTAAGFPWSSGVRGSFSWVLGRVIGLASGAAYRFLTYIASGIHASTSRDLEQLRLFGEDRGIDYKSGTLATGIATIIGSVTAGGALPANSWLVSTITGLRWKTTAPVTVAAGGTEDVAIQAEYPGSEYLVVAEPFRITTVPVGIEAFSELTANAGGFAEEGIESYRGRILDALARPPEGGAVADWQAWTRELLTQAVEGVWVYAPADVVPAGVDPSGFVDPGDVAVLYALSGSGTAKIPSGPNVTSMNTHLRGHADRPVTSYPTAFAPVDNNVAIAITAHLGTGAVQADVEDAIEAALQTMLDDRLGDLPTPGVTSGDVVRNSWIQGAIASVAGLDWYQVTAIDGGGGDANVATTFSWELTRFTVTFSWV